jgi:PKD repeat protein
MSTLQNPSHTYAPIAAAYNVTLVATNEFGSSAPVVMQLIINPAVQ